MRKWNESQDMMTWKKYCLSVVLIGICLASLSWAAPETGVEPDEPFTFLNDPNLSKGYENKGSGMLLVRALIALLFVIAMGVGVTYFSKKILPKLGVSPGKDIHVLETVGIGPRKALHLIEVGSQKILIGSTPDHISFLTRVDSDGEFADVMAARYDSPEASV